MSGHAAVLDAVVEMASELLADSDRDLADLLAIGVGVPGPVEHRTGMPINPPIMPGWNRFDVPGYLQDHFHVPVLVDNDVNVMALGERHAGVARSLDDLLFVKVGTGVGCGIRTGGATTGVATASSAGVGAPARAAA